MRFHESQSAKIKLSAVGQNLSTDDIHDIATFF